MCLTRELSKKGETIIMGCIECNAFYVFHNNLMLSFKQEEFEIFRADVEDLSFNEGWVPFPDGSKKVILHTPNSDISFSFAAEELELFKTAIAESIFMQEVYILTNGSGREE